jgi:hypothetical protein
MKEFRRLGNMRDLLELSKWVADRGLPRVYPALQAVMSQTEATVSYVAHVPAPVSGIEEWHAKMKELLPAPQK